MANGKVKEIREGNAYYEIDLACMAFRKKKEAEQRKQKDQEEAGKQEREKADS